MDFQKFADSFFSPTCIVSVEKKAERGFGDIRFVAGNEKYIDMIEMRLENDDFYVAPDAGNKFVPNSLYFKYFPKNRSFEDACFRAAVQKTPVHTYVYLNNVDVWLDIYAMPIDFEDGNTYYCTYTATTNQNADVVLDTLYTAQTSNDVLKTCIKLHRSNDLEEAMEGVITEIRQICNAEGCTVLLLNDSDRTFSILATDFRAESHLKRVTNFSNFYDIATSWKSMIGEEGDCIIIKNKDDMDYVSKINNPWYLTLVEAGVESVVLFPLRQGHEVLGFIWATNFDTNKTRRIKETLELTTFFISSHIARFKVIKRLQYMSYTDALTGMPNRFACTDYIADLIRREERFTVVSIDLNHFKSVNVTLGLEAGNKVLIEIAKRWKAVSDNAASGSSDYVTRINGDEFLLIIFGYKTQEEVRNTIISYADALSEQLVVDGCDLYVTASFGYAEYPTDAVTADSLISNATLAMNAIKKANSSDHILKFSSDAVKNERTLEIENKIRNALENDTIFFNLQPQYDMAHKLRGFEALARMKDSDGNFISPGEFIPIAEKVGLIDRVDNMVFKKSSAFFSSLIKKTGLDLTLSLNASVRHLMKNDFLEEIHSLIDKSGISPEHFEIEITESILIDSADKALQCINKLREMGVKLAIDDFGTGYSSLSYLNKIPANLLKIDKSFIDKINANESSKQYVAAIISMGHIMGLDVISEGVEEEEQLEALRSIGCDYVQGYIWGRPMSAEDAEKLVNSLGD